MEPQWVNVIILAVLAVITAYYARETRRIAKTSEEQAKELKQQRISSSQPVVWPMISGWKVYYLEVVFENIGNGPALDVDIFIGRGEKLMFEDSEHIRHSYMVAGEKKINNFLMLQNLNQDAYGQPSPDKDTLAHITGKYTLLVEWRDLYKSGPFFQAKLPFSLEINSAGKLYVKDGVVVINPVPEKRK